MLSVDMEDEQPISAQERRSSTPFLILFLCVKVAVVVAWSMGYI